MPARAPLLVLVLGLACTANGPADPASASSPAGAPPGSFVGDPVWSTDVTAFAAINHGGGYRRPGVEGSTCKIGAESHTVELAARRLSWETCEGGAPHEPLHPVTGERTLTEAELEHVLTTMRGVSLGSEGGCTADGPVLELQLISPTGTRSFGEASVAECSDTWLRSFVWRIDEVIKLLRGLGRVPQVEQQCASGTAAACTRMGEFRQRASVPQGTAAASFLKKGCDGGDVWGCALLATELEREDSARARELHERACKQGIASACQRIGYFYEDGMLDHPKDPVRAKEWFARACEVGGPAYCPR